jgi:hypothetical protein
MKNQVEAIIQAIRSEQTALNEQAARRFEVISANVRGASSLPSKEPKGAPPISYILYGVAGLSAIGTLSSESSTSRALCGCLTVASAYFGYKSSTGAGHSTPIPAEQPHISQVKSEVTDKVNDAVKRLSDDWRRFMEKQQNDLQQAIQASSLSTDEKDEKLSKIFVYEVMDISLLELSKLIGNAQDANSVKQQLSLCQSKVTQAIAQAVEKQIEKYQSVC